MCTYTERVSGIKVRRGYQGGLVWVTTSSWVVQTIERDSQAQLVHRGVFKVLQNIIPESITIK